MNQTSMHQPPINVTDKPKSLLPKVVLMTPDCLRHDLGFRDTRKMSKCLKQMAKPTVVIRTTIEDPVIYDGQVTMIKNPAPTSHKFLV